MESPLYSTPQCRVQAAISLATREFESNINLKAYEQVPNPNFPNIYEAHYLKLIDEIISEVRACNNGDELFHAVISKSKQHAMDLSEEGIAMARMELRQKADVSSSKLPDNDDYEAVTSMMNEHAKGQQV